MASRPHAFDLAVSIDVPEPDGLVADDPFDLRQGIEKRPCHLGDVHVCTDQAEQMTSLEGLKLCCPITDSLVLRQKCPSVRAALSDPVLVRDVTCIVRVVIGDQVDYVACISQSGGRRLPRLRSRKNSGRSAEDILDDVDGQVVLICD